MSDEPDKPILAAIKALQVEFYAGHRLVVEQLEGLGAGQARLDANLSKVRVELMARIDRLQNSLTAIRDDIGVNMGAAEAMQRANDNTRELVRLQGDQLSAMWRQLKALEARVREITGDP